MLESNSHPNNNEKRNRQSGIEERCKNREKESGNEMDWQTTNELKKSKVITHNTERWVSMGQLKNQWSLEGRKGAIKLIVVSDNKRKWCVAGEISAIKQELRREGRTQGWSLDSRADEKEQAMRWRWRWRNEANKQDLTTSRPRDVNGRRDSQGWR